MCFACYPVVQGVIHSYTWFRKQSIFALGSKLTAAIQSQNLFFVSLLLTFLSLIRHALALTQPVQLDPSIHPNSAL